MFDLFARGLHAHVNLFICTFAWLNKNSETRDQKQQNGLYEPYEWGMGKGQWAMGNGQWTMGNGQWAMGNGQWAMGNWK